MIFWLLGVQQSVLEMLRANDKQVLALTVIIELISLKGSDFLRIPVFSEVKY